MLEEVQMQSMDGAIIGTENAGVRFCAIGDSVIDYNMSLMKMFAGGNAYNFAMLCRRLGYESSYIGVVGNDDAGILIRRTLEAQGVGIDHLTVHEGQSGLCRIDLVDGNRTITDINDHGVTKSDPLQLTDEMLETVSGHDLIHTSCYSFLEPQIPKMKSTGVPVLYDASDKWTNESLLLRSREVDYLLFSGKDQPLHKLEPVIRPLAGEGSCRLAIVTSGAEGAIVYDGREFFRVEPFFASEPIIDSTGAGDHWIVGFITTWIRGKKIRRQFGRNSLIQPPWKADDADDVLYDRALMQLALYTGNVMARYGCMHEGSFGVGFPFSGREEFL